MGFSLSWVAVKDMPESELLAAFKTNRTGETSEWPDFSLSLLEKKNGWRIVLADHDDLLNGREPLKQKLSAKNDVIVVFVEEHVMYSGAALS